MKVCIVGAGAIGGFLGLRLARAAIAAVNAAGRRLLLRGDARFTDARVRQVFDVWGDMLRKGYFLDATMDQDADRVLPYLYRNHVGMTLIGSFVAARFPEAIAPDMGFFAFPNYSPAIPAFEEAPLDVLVQPASGLNPAARKRFLTFLAESGSLRQIAEADQTLSAQADSPPSSVLLGEASSNILGSAAGLTYFFDRDAKAELVGPLFDGLRQFLKAPHDTELVVQFIGTGVRGGVALVERATGIDYNPERIQLDDGLNGITMPAGINTGDSLGTVTGVLSYSFDNYELLLTQLPTVTVNPLPPSVRSIQVGGDRLSVGAYNVENLDPNDTSFARLAGQIVNAIGAPDVLALSELQDNNGATNNGTVSADQTIALLHDAIVAAGGPSYEAVQINPVNNQDGGEPGGNIRVVQFYNPLRVSFVPGTAGSGGSLDATAPTQAGGKLALTLSPGR
eukprot:gene42641-52894_t